MATQLLSLHLLCLTVASILATPDPGRVPKVYNALITSNQNLEPSKAYPVYQPVLHETAFTFPFQPVFYGADFPISNGILPVPALPPKHENSAQIPTEAPAADIPKEASAAPTEAPAITPEPSSPQPDSVLSTPHPPPPPNTESPIPLNEFGLPPQVLPLGRVDSPYDRFAQISPFTYTYPGFRFYDPYDPFSLNPYSNFGSLYRPLTNVLGQSNPVVVNKEPAPVAPATPTEQSAQTPPPEPSDLNVLNYSSKDPAIPNVPPPPLPQGGLKSDKPE